MPSNTRGKIKEQLEGIHRNTEAIKAHCVKILALIDTKNPKLSSGFEALTKMNDLLDESAQQLYSRI